MLACTALVGCTSDDVIDNVTPDKDGLKNFAVKVAINVGEPSTTSRALTGNYDDGDVAEYGVTKAVVAFYNAQKFYLGQAVVTNAWVDDTDDSVTKETTCVFQAAEKPFYAIALLNPSTSIEGLLVENRKISDLATASTETLVTEKNEFFMLNSTYVDANGVVRTEVELGNNVVEVKDNETVETALTGANIVDIYVDRVAAKVTMDFNSIKNTVKATYNNKKVYALKYHNYEEGSDGSSENENNQNTTELKEAPFGIMFEGWAISGTNKQFYPIKKLQASYTGLERITWNVATDFLSHWAEDPNYSDGTYPAETSWDALEEYEDSYSLSYDNDIDEDVTKPLYCYENTYVQAETLNYPAQTYVVLKAQYMDLTTSEGSTTATPYEGIVYRIGQVVYKEEAIKNEILGLLFNSYIVKQVSNETETEISLTNENIATLRSKLTLVGGENFGTNEKVQQIIFDGYKVYKKDGTTEVTNIKNEFVGSAEILIHAGGECVYTIPIEHFGKVNESRTNKSLGYWGVVRNHWYVLSVTNIAGFGDPKVEGEPTIPDPTPLKTWAVQCTININAWSKVSQSTEIGSGNEWN